MRGESRPGPVEITPPGTARGRRDDGFLEYLYWGELYIGHECPTP